MSEVISANKGEDQKAFSYEDVEEKFIEREQRAFHVLHNLWLYSIKTRIFSGDINSRYQAASIKAYINWWVFRLSRISRTAAVAGGVSITALAGVAIAYKANQLLDAQNTLSEAQRRAALTTELTSIYDKMWEEIRKAEIKDVGAAEPIHLSAILQARIIAASNAARPYQYLDLERRAAELEYLPRQTEDGLFHKVGDWVENDLLREPPLSQLRSPERGQILVILHRSNVDYAEILSQGSFNFSDLFSAEIHKIRLMSTQKEGLRMQRSILQLAKLRDSEIKNVDLSYSNLSGADFTGANIQDMVCSGCIATPYQQVNIEMNGSDWPTYLRAKQISGGGFLDARLDGVYIDGVLIRNVNFLALDKPLSLNKAVFNGSVFIDDKGKLVEVSASTNSGSMGTDSAMQAVAPVFIEAKEASFNGTRFEGYPLANILFQNGKFRGARFFNTVVEGVDFSGADLAGANFDRVAINSTGFGNANVECTDFRKAFIDATSLNSLKQATNLNKALLSPEQRIVLGLESEQKSCELSDPTLGAQSERPGTRFAQVDYGKKLSFKNLDGAVFKDLKLQDIEISGDSAAGANFDGVEFTNVKINITNMDGATFRGSIFRGKCELVTNRYYMDFLGADVAGLQWRDYPAKPMNWPVEDALRN